MEKVLASAVFILVTICDLQAAVTPKVDNSAIKYPGPIKTETQAETNFRFNVDDPDDVPESCKDLTYCTVKPKNFPEEKFNKMFTGYKSPPQPSLVVELTNKQGDPDDNDNCDSEVTYEPLYKVREKRDEPWRTVVQAPGRDFVQKIRLERCMNPDAPCFKVFTQIPEIVTYCKQKYNKWEVLVAKGDNETETIIAELPVCCSCHYKPKAFVTRFGLH